MSNIINQNLDEIISIKNQLSNVLIENGIEAGNRFSDYPDMFRSVIASGGSFNPSYYYTADEIDENFVSYSYLAAALEDIDVDVDLDDYVTYSYAYNTFVSYAYLGDLEQISEYILGSGSSSAPENVYATKTELGAYVSKDLLSTLGYITANDIDIPVINENLIPKENNTYTLGDTGHLYAATYSSRLKVGNNSQIYNDGGGITVSINSNNGVRFGSNSIYPKTSGAFSLGDTDHFYTNTYSTNLYLSNIHGFRNNSNLSFYAYVAGSERYVFSQSGFYPVQSNRSLGQNNNNNKWGAAYISNLYADTSYTKTVVPDGSDTYFLGDTSNYYHSTYTNRIRGNSSINFVVASNNRLTVSSTAFRPMQQNYNLGSSDYPFATAYISNIYNFIWTGTSAEYAALDNYTSYQIYLIQEA